MGKSVRKAVPGDGGQDSPVSEGGVSKPTSSGASSSPAPAETPKPPPEPPAPVPPAGSPEEGGSVGTVVLNGVLLVLFLLAIDQWVVRFTNWKQDHVGVLGIAVILAGLRAVFDLVLKLLGEDRQKQILQMIDQRIFRNHGTWRYLLGTGVALGLLGSCWSPVELKSSQAASCKVEFYRADAKPAKESRKPVAVVSLDPQETSRKLLWMGFWGREKFDIQAEGFPVLPRTFRSWHPFSWRPVPLSVPASFTKVRVLLIYPAKWISGTAYGNPSWMRVTIGAKTAGLLQGYRGESVWIGGGRGKLSIPPAVKEKWSDRIEEPEYLDRVLSSPKSLAPDAELAPGARVLVELFTCDPRGSGCRPYAKAESSVSEEPDFPQEVYLNEAVS